jgi:hypothetical protein
MNLTWIVAKKRKNVFAIALNLLKAPLFLIKSSGKSGRILRRMPL